MRSNSLFVAIAVAALMLISPASAVDTDGDGLLDLLDIPGFPNTIFSGRGIQDLDGANQLTNLLLLDLNTNQITSLESGDFDGLTNLLVLMLNRNQITSLESGDFEGLTNLQSLRLDRNEITSLESGAFQGLTNLVDLDLTTIAITELNFTGAMFERLTNCNSGSQGFCADTREITSLILDDAVLSLGSFEAIVDQTASITDVSLVGLTFLGTSPSDLGDLLDISTLDNVTVSQTLFDSYADEFNAFDALDGNTVTVVPDLGDYNANGMLDAGDLNLQAAAIRSGQNPEDFDHTYDELVNIDDRIRWVEDLKNTYFGDANLDGEFNSGDLTKVLAAGEFDDDLDGNSGWDTGDWNADGDFTSADLVVALADGGFGQGPRAATAAVPEPMSAVLLCIGLLAFAGRKVRR